MRAGIPSQSARVAADVSPRPRRHGAEAPHSPGRAEANASVQGDAAFAAVAPWSFGDGSGSLIGLNERALANMTSSVSSLPGVVTMRSRSELPSSRFHAMVGQHRRSAATYSRTTSATVGSNSTTSYSISLMTCRTAGATSKRLGASRGRCSNSQTSTSSSSGIATPSVVMGLPSRVPPRRPGQSVSRAGTSPSLPAEPLEPGRRAWCCSV